MSYEYILFDLDGTLINSIDGILYSLKYTLQQMNKNFPFQNKNKLLQFIGPPLQDSFREILKFSEKETQMAINYYQSYYEKNCWQEGQLYQDIDKVLKELVRQRKKIYIATNKPERFALRILKHFEIYDYFTAIFGEPMNARLMRKGDIIRFALGYMYLIEEDRKKIVMIGDRIYDIIGAFENNIETIGVTYGAGAKEELEKAQAKYIVDKAADLLNYL